jgi:hypothetical protein
LVIAEIMYQRYVLGRQRLHRRWGITPAVLSIIFDTRLVTPENLNIIRFG